MMLLKRTYHYLLSWLGSVVHRHPSRKLFIIGVTGTKGKTTSVELIHAVFMGAGHKTAMLSSAHIKFGNDVEKNPKSNTMPGRFFVERFLARAVARGCTHAVVEVTSQGVVQHRHRFIDFDAAALTNLHPEHIESHGSFESYRAAKVAFFRYVSDSSKKLQKSFFINGDCADRNYFEEASRGIIVQYRKDDFVQSALMGDRAKVSEWLRSDFNLENAALAYAVAISQGIRGDAALSVLKSFKGVPGRLEFISNGQKTAVVDYALTPDSLKALYAYVRKWMEEKGMKGRIIAVFGSAGGGRDIWKRKELGKIAGESCKKIYLTSDDSYDEDPRKIIAAIAEGIEDRGRIKIVIDRQAAIQEALQEAGRSDVVAITGMGSQSFTYGPKGKKIPWSDRGAVEEALRSLAK